MAECSGGNLNIYSTEATECLKKFLGGIVITEEQPLPTVESGGQEKVLVSDDTAQQLLLELILNVKKLVLALEIVIGQDIKEMDTKGV